MCRIDLEKRDDAAAQQARDERADLEEAGIELRLRRKFLRQQRIRSLRHVVCDDLQPVLVRDRSIEHGHVRISERGVVQRFCADAEPGRHLRQHAGLPGDLVQQSRFGEFMADGAVLPRESLPRL